MQIVIDIHEKDYQSIKNGHIPFSILDVLMRGTPLPKGHGDLIDTIKLKAKMFDLPQQPEGNYWDGVDAVGELIDNAPTIIEADNVESEAEE
jgi:hypothetical protein